MTTSLTGISNAFDLDDINNLDWGNLTITSSNLNNTLSWNGISNSVSPIITTDGNRQLSVKGDSHFDGDAQIDGKLIVGGVDIGDSLTRIEQRLAILRPNPRLEGEWEELRALGERYRELEERLLDGERILEILGNPPVDE